MLERGKADLDDLIPRIRDLLQREKDLLKAAADAKTVMEQGSMHLVDAEQVLEYVQDLGRILEVGSAGERQQFLRSFVRSIAWTEPEVTIEYTLPIPTSTVH